MAEQKQLLVKAWCSADQHLHAIRCSALHFSRPPTARMHLCTRLPSEHWKECTRSEDSRPRHLTSPRSHAGKHRRQIVFWTLPRGERPPERLVKLHRRAEPDKQNNLRGRRYAEDWEERGHRPANGAVSPGSRRKVSGTREGRAGGADRGSGVAAYLWHRAPPNWGRADKIIITRKYLHPGGKHLTFSEATQSRNGEKNTPRFNLSCNGCTQTHAKKKKLKRHYRVCWYILCVSLLSHLNNAREWCPLCPCGAGRDVCPDFPTGGCLRWRAPPVLGCCRPSSPPSSARSAGTGPASRGCWTGRRGTCRLRSGWCRTWRDGISPTRGTAEWREVFCQPMEPDGRPTRMSKITVVTGWLVSCARASYLCVSHAQLKRTFHADIIPNCHYWKSPVGMQNVNRLSYYSLSYFNFIWSNNYFVFKSCRRRSIRAYCLEIAIYCIGWITSIVFICWHPESEQELFYPHRFVAISPEMMLIWKPRSTTINLANVNQRKCITSWFVSWN